MKKIEILDCTLRDGGYINDWMFGLKNIKNIISTLDEANIDYIECGFVNNLKYNYNENQTIFYNTEDIKNIIAGTSNSKCTLMMQVNKYDINKLPKCSKEYANIIRLSFHKCDIKEIGIYTNKIKECGYKLFLQPTIIKRYSKNELKELLNYCNQVIKPDGMAIVDTLGEMSLKEVEEITKIFDKYLDKSIKLSFHGHNNLQLAFSNAITFINNVSSKRNVIVDTTLMGMGRNSGNVCTELMADYLNKNHNANYNFDKLLKIIDSVIYKYKKKCDWSYSPTFVLNAILCTHPNYSKFFLEKASGLSIEDLNYLLNKLPIDNKDEYEEKVAYNILNHYINKRDEGDV